MNFVPQIHIIGKTLVPYAYLMRFIANLGKKIEIFIWYEYYHVVNMVSDYTEFQNFFITNLRRWSFCFVYGGLVSLTLRI